jgi:hypothetical protein
MFAKNKGGENTGTNKAHDDRWAPFESWCSSMGVSAFDFSVPYILRYVTEVLVGSRHVGHAACRAFLGTCTVTKMACFPDQPPLSDHPLIKAFKQGVAKTVPSGGKVKPTTYFSLHRLFVHIASMSDNDDTCSIAVLRDKLILLLLIDGMARASDIETITREGIVFRDQMVHFRYYWTKETKTPQEVPMSINDYPSQRSICTVTVMRKYLARTASAQFPVATRSQWVEGKLLPRTPLLIQDHKKKGDTFFPVLGRERIAKIAVIALKAIGAEGYTAHNVRGASASKCRNLGSPFDTICARARWANEQTFLVSYYRRCTYVGPPFGDRQLEWLVRYAPQRVGG